MSSVPDIQFRPMLPADLPAIVVAEQGIYPFPWTLGNFSESLACEDRAWIAESAGQLG